LWSRSSGVRDLLELWPRPQRGVLLRLIPNRIFPAWPRNLPAPVIFPCCLGQGIIGLILRFPRKIPR
jgi:hypothetical protein